MAEEKDKPLDWNLTVEGLKDLQAGNVEDAMAALRAAQQIQADAENNAQREPEES